MAPWRGLGAGRKAPAARFLFSRAPASKRMGTGCLAGCAWLCCRMSPAQQHVAAAPHFERGLVGLAAARPDAAVGVVCNNPAWSVSGSTVLVLAGASRATPPRLGAVAMAVAVAPRGSARHCRVVGRGGVGHGSLRLEGWWRAPTRPLQAPGYIQMRT